MFDLDDADPAPTGLLTLTRARARSTVHRDVPLDSVTVRVLDADGTTGGELRLLGLYTANVFSDSVEHHPGRAPQGGGRCWPAPGSRPTATTVAR